MPPPRPRGVGYNTGVTSARSNQNTPMSERQQMALLIQMTSTGNDLTRGQVKKNDHKKGEDTSEGCTNDKHDSQDIHREKTSTDDSSTENKKDAACTDNNNVPESSAGTASGSKRNFSDVEEEYEDNDDLKKKKKKESDAGGKESKTLSNLRPPIRSEKNTKQMTTLKNSPTSTKTALTATEKDASESKPNFSKAFENDAEDDDFKLAENLYNEGLKVPPLKIVIPQQNCSLDTDGNVSRTGKINISRNAALPYVVSSSNEISGDRDATTAQQCSSPPEGGPPKPNPTSCTATAPVDDKNVKMSSEEKNLQRVLRSSHRSGVPNIERSSNNSSPQMQSSSPSPASSTNANEATENKQTFLNTTSSPQQPSSQQPYEPNEPITNLPSPSTSSTSSSKEVPSSSSVELHPRKRKIRSKNDETHMKSSNNANSGVQASSETSSVPEAHPHDFPFTNCFQMYLNIRRQIEKKWKNLYPIKPRPPQGYNEYLINRRNYLLKDNKSRMATRIPPTISPKMRDIFLIQEKERQELQQRHMVERDKLCLNVEQEIIRVHSKAARNISCQPVPFSICTLLKDEEVYNVITPEQEEKDRNARHRFNGRLLLSWLQDVDDKWEKIKESMVLRHHNEAESLHAVQLMDWEIALKKFELCDFKTQLVIESDHVPCVHVNDDFDLLPA